MRGLRMLTLHFLDVCCVGLHQLPLLTDLIIELHAGRVELGDHGAVTCLELSNVEPG